MSQTSLVSSVERVRVKVVKPFLKLETQSTLLARVHATTDLLRRAARIHQLSKKLTDLDPLRAAHVLSELDELYKDSDLTGLKILENEEKMIQRESSVVKKKASKIVEEGLSSLNQEKVCTGIEIMVRLGIADVEIQKLMDEWLRGVEQNVRKSLSMEHLVPAAARGGAGRVSGVSIPTNIENFRNRLWSSWETTLHNTVYTTCAQMALIQNVLNNKISGNSSFRGNEEKSEVAHLYWTQVDDIMTKQLTLAAKESSHMKQALDGEYPKLLRLHLDLHKKLKALNSSETGKPIFPSMGKCVKQFETSYLSWSVMLVLNDVREMFPDGETSPVQPPTTEKVDVLVKTIYNELSVSLVDEELTLPVAKNVAKAVSLFCQKGEQMLDNSTESTQVVETPTACQELNVEVANVVYYLCEQVKAKVSNLGLSKKVASCILQSLTAGENLTQQILNPLLASILVAIESILLTMHNEDYNINEYNGSVSPYMRELQTFTARAVTSYLSPFQNKLQVTNSCMEVASRAIELFLRHTSMVRPLSEAGKQKLTADFKSFEDAISPLCVHLSELGSVYSTLRSIRPLISATPQEVATSPVLGQVIPYSLAVALLVSRAPPELPSPHTSVGWTISKLSEWLDNHTSETDRLELYAGAIKQYEVSVCAQNLSTFHDIYPVIKSLIENGVKYVQSSEALKSII